MTLISNQRPYKVHGFLLAIELEEGVLTTPEDLRLRLAGACQWIDGVGTIDCDHIGVVSLEGDDDKHKA